MSTLALMSIVNVSIDVNRQHFTLISIVKVSIESDVKVSIESDVKVSIDVKRQASRL